MPPGRTALPVGAMSPRHSWPASRQRSHPPLADDPCTSPRMLHRSDLHATCAFRPARCQVAYGYGTHRCMAERLALVEIEEALKGLARFLPDIKLAVPPEQLEWRWVLWVGQGRQQTSGGVPELAGWPHDATHAAAGGP